MALNHWGRVTHICVGNSATIGSDNGLSPGRRQAIIWTNAGILSIGPSGTNFSEFVFEIHAFSFKKMHLKLSSAKWQQFCLGLNVLKLEQEYIITSHSLHGCNYLPWASYQISKFAGCACAGNARNVSLRRRFQRKQLEVPVCSRHVRHARAVIHVGIAYPRWRGKRSRHSRSMRTRNFRYLVRGPCHRLDVYLAKRFQMASLSRGSLRASRL